VVVSRRVNSDVVRHLLKTMKLVAGVIILLLVAGSIAGQECHCKRAAKDDDTRGGANEYIAFREKRTYRHLRGFVHTFADDDTLANVLVEVYTYSPSLLAKGYEAGNLRGRRIAACVTGEDGSFCFNRIPAGRYELRTSLASG
jgi:hypothetical protein